MISSVRVCQHKKQLCNKCKMVKCFFQAIKEEPQSISYQLLCSKSVHCSNLYIGNHCMTLLKLHMEWMTVILIHYFHKWAVIDLNICVFNELMLPWAQSRKAGQVYPLCGQKSSTLSWRCSATLNFLPPCNHDPIPAWSVRCLSEVYKAQSII